MPTTVRLTIIALVIYFRSGSCLVCDDPSDVATGVCGQLSRDLERALISDEGNIFRIRRAFFHSPTSSPILLKVVYNITYGEKIIVAVADEEVLPCWGQILNSTMELNQTSHVTLGWTSSGVYTMFHPTVLSVMQVHSPFAFLRVIHLTLDDQRSPEADTFLWDGSYDLPTLYLNLHITSLTCIPSQELFESVLRDLNTLIKLYEGQNEVPNIHEKFEFIGFTLPHTSVSSKIIPMGSDVIFINLYSSILCFLYIVSISLFTIWYYHSKKVKKLINGLINDNADLAMGIRITTTTALVVEFVARIVGCSIWTHNIENAMGILFGVWMPQIHLLVMAIIQIVFVSLYVGFQKKKATGKFDCDSKAEIRTFSNMTASAFGLFYMLFPTIILMFAHPTQIIVIFTFVTAYMFATTIFTASIIKLYNRFQHKSNKRMLKQQHSCKPDEKQKQENPLVTKCFVFLLFATLWLIVVYLHFLVVFVSYSLLIGKGSVINTGPLFLISLLPSAILSGGAWIAKRIAFNDDSESNGDQKDKKEPESDNQKFQIENAYVELKQVGTSNKFSNPTFDNDVRVDENALEADSV